MKMGQAARFVLVGGSAAVGYLIVGVILHQTFGLTLMVANAIAICVMHPFSYLGHRFITFQYAGSWIESIRRFSVVAALSTTSSVVSSWLQAQWHVPVLTALLLNCVVVPVITMLTLKLWVFSHPSPKCALR